MFFMKLIKACYGGPNIYRTVMVVLTFTEKLRGKWLKWLLTTRISSADTFCRP